MSSRAVVIGSYGGLQSIDVAEVQVAPPRAGEVTVRVEAGAIGPWDVFTADGAFAALLDDSDIASTFPMVLGWDFAGIVDQAGDEVDLKPGARVMGMSRQPLTGVGVHAEAVTLPAELCVEIPDAVDAADAATVPCCALTAWQAIDEAGLSGDDALLVIGATGQLGGFVTQLAAKRGHTVIASVAAAAAEEATSLGATAVVDREGDVGAQVRELFPDGVAASFDPVGGKATAGAVAALRDEGVQVRAVTWAEPAAERSIETRTMFVQDDRPTLATLGEMLAEGAITARISEVMPLSAARLGYETVVSGSPGGKVLLDPTR
jgi:NADPH2:quinone reductase